MASRDQCLVSLARLSLSSAARPSTASIPRFLAPSLSQARHASSGGGGAKKREKKKKTHKAFRAHPLDDMAQYSLCDAVRYLRAFEVGRPPSSVKYDIAVKLKSLKNGPIIRSRIRFPHPVKTDTRIAVIASESSPVAAEARQLGAVAVGQESLFEAIRAGDIEFNRLICHTDSLQALNKAGLGKILGPKGLMPNAKTKTVTSNVKGLMREMAGAEQYREKDGVVRVSVGQLGFTAEMLADNIKAMMAHIRENAGKIENTIDKSVHEVVLSSSNGPGLSLNGGFNPSDEAILPAHLSSTM